MQQQHASGQPPGKKLRVTGNYAGADPSEYDFQVCHRALTGLVEVHGIVVAEEPKLATTTAAAAADLSAARLLIRWLLRRYMWQWIIYFLVHSLFPIICKCLCLSLSLSFSRFRDLLSIERI